MSSKIALVLSGGGAKGAFQFGAIQYIEEYYKKQNPSFNYSIIAGVSVGALNATMLAMEKYEVLKEVWTTISADRVREDPEASANIFNIAKRSLTEIAIDEIFNSDISEFLRINRLVQQAERQNCQLLKQDGRPYRSFRTILIQPDDDLGDTLDFSEKVIKERIFKGFNAARRAFEVGNLK